MAIIRKQRGVTKSRHVVKRDIPNKWWSEFVNYFDHGSAWNERCNGWVNEQYKRGVTPRAAFRKCRVIQF